MPFVAPDRIDTARLIIRPIAASDLPALMAVNGDGEVTKFLPYATWTALADAEAWYKRMCDLQVAGAAIQFVIVEKQSDTAIATCLLFRYDETSARAELGYAMGRSCWGSGYMHEALTALIDCAFNKMLLRRLEADIDPVNAASARLLTRLGFLKEGLLRQRWVSKGVIQDAEIYGLLREEWHAT